MLLLESSILLIGRLLHMTDVISVAYTGLYVSLGTVELESCGSHQLQS